MLNSELVDNNDVRLFNYQLPLPIITNNICLAIAWIPITCSKLTIEMLEQEVKYVQS